MARAAAPMLSGFRVETRTTRRLSFQLLEILRSYRRAAPGGLGSWLLTIAPPARAGGLPSAASFQPSPQPACYILGLRHYPIFLDLKDRPVLVVGAGKVALRKTRGLLEAGARITVVAPEW